MKVLYKSLVMGFAFLCVGIFFFLLIGKRNYSGYALNTTGAFLKQSFCSEDQVLLSKSSAFFTHIKLLWNLDKRVTDGFLIENIANMKVAFKSYYSLHVLFNEIFVHKCYCFKTENKSPLIIDCGGNIGMSILFFKMLYPKSVVLAFEPCRGNFELLQKNINENQLSGVILEKKALADKSGTINLYNPESLTGTIFEECKDKNNQNIEQVQTAKLSDYIDKEVDFLKVDVEGAETMVFQDLVDSGKLNLVKQTIIECHTNKNLVRLLNIFEDNGFFYKVRSEVKTPFSRDDKAVYLLYAYRE